MYSCGASLECTPDHPPSLVVLWVTGACIILIEMVVVSPILKIYKLQFVPTARL